MAEKLTFDVTDETFQSAVLERSREVPVVVDFWAPWCGPCRSLGPMLEKLAGEHAGAFLLAKLNVDENPKLAQAFGVQSIPMVLAFRDGGVAAEFVGALPESSVREFIGRVLPSAADRLATKGEDLTDAGRLEEAEEAFRSALGQEPRHDRALIGLAALLAERGETDEALELLERVLPGPMQEVAERLAAQIRVGQGKPAADVGAMERKVAESPDDLEARFALAHAYAARGQHEKALAAYLEIVRRDREFRDDGARKAMVDLFAVLGTDHPLTGRYRSELAKVLFR